MRQCHPTRFAFHRGNRMTTHHIDPERFFNTMGQHPSALRVLPGDTVVMQTLDALGVDRTGAHRGEPPNPESGCIWVEGATPGDALEVTIVRLTPSRRIGWTRYPLAANVVDPDRVTHLPERETAEWAIDVAAETVRLIEPPPALAALSLERVAQELPGVRCCGDETILGRLSRPLAARPGRRAGASRGHPHLRRHRPNDPSLAAAAPRDGE